MYKRIFNKLLIGLVIIFVLFITFTASTNSFAQTLSEEKVYCDATLEDEFADNRVLVVLDKSSSYSKNVYDESTFSKYNCTDVTELTYMSTSELRTNNSDAAINTSNYNKVLCLELANNSKSNVLNVIKDLIQREDVIYAGPDYKIAISSTIPNDSLLENQWAVDSIELSKAWDYTQGTHDILVGVMDTGIDGSHPDLSDSIVNNLCRDFTSGTEVIKTNPIDPNGHGTHVAGIIGGIGNNNKGVAGVNWNVGLVSLRVLDENGTGYTSNVAKAIKFASENNISILNLSASWDIDSANYNFALENTIYNYNGLLICASGNDNKDIDGKSISIPSSIDLPNIISVGSHDPDNKKSSFSNYGKNSVDLFAPGNEIYSTLPNNSYGFKLGTSMATPYVTGVAALLLSMNENLTNIQLKEAILNSVDIPNVNGVNPLKNLCVTNGKLNAHNAVKYVLKNYMNYNTYTLGNYSSPMDMDKVVTTNALHFNELNGFYKLNVTYEKNYEFISSSTSEIDVTLYDDDFNKISYTDLESRNDCVHFVKKLRIGMYYLRTKYINEKNTGTINTKIISRNTTYLGIGKNDLLINTYNNISEYVYVNNQGEGFYKFYFDTNINMSYAEGTLKIYSDENRTSLLNKYGSTEIEEAAMTYNGEKELYVYLPANGRYYLDINLLNKNYLSASITVKKIEKEKINYQGRITSTSLDELFTNKTETGYFKEIVISHSSKMELDIMTNGTINRNIPVYIFKKYCDDEHGNNYYSINLELYDYITSTEKYPVFTVILSAGTYYIGYSDNTNNVSIQFMLSRKVSENLNIDSTLVTDPARDQGFHLGSEVTLNNGILLGDTITEGFTRNIYLMVEDRLREPMSRLEYDWYSSDESIAKVTAYGTVLAMQVDRDKEVTIYAVLKVDPSIVYRKTFTILNDTSNEEIVITCNMSFSYSLENEKYKLELNDSNSPYPMIQYYDWSVFIPCQENSINVSMNYWGIITATEPGNAIITGVYQINTRVKIVIHLKVTE